MRELPSATVACAIHNGLFITINEVNSAIGKWMDANSYRIVGPSREVYLNPAKNGSHTDPNTIAEIQFLVDKA